MVLTGYFSGELTHRCTPQTDKVWGCTTEAKKPRFNLPCWRCLKPGYAECEVCKGQGVVGMTRCPNAINTGTLNKAFSFYSVFSNYHVLPVEGGLLDQTSYFLKLVNVAPSFEGAWRDMKERNEKVLKSLKSGVKKNVGK